MRITGTFLDEVTHDIPSQNWGAVEWRKEFALYQKIGIDTVIVIRAGYRDKCIFPSRSIDNALPVQDDLARLFLDLAEEHGQQLFFGTYDSGDHWLRGDWRQEVDINRRFIDEATKRYADHSAFKGWYMCHETARNHLHITDLFNQIGRHCKSAKDVPVLISPFPMGEKQAGKQHAISLKTTFHEWDTIFAETKGAIDVCAFQDGQIHYRELPEFHAGISSLTSKHGVKLWANVESFDRDMPIKFPPADWRYLRLKLGEAAKVAEKIVTFEFAHFMSPHSVWPSAHNLFARYCEAFGVSP
jgi:hypothetical protein